MESVIFIVKDAEEDKFGFTQLYPSFSSISMERSWILNDLFVDEDYRKQGIAQLLLDAAQQHGQLTGAKGIGLTTGKNNVTAQRVYERNQYIKVEEFYHYDLTL